jgi:hypothetical protein
MMDSLSTWLSAKQTFPSMTQLFIDHLNAWQNHQELLFPEPTVPFLALPTKNKHISDGTTFFEDEYPTSGLPSNWHATNDLKTDVLVTHGHKI